MRVTDLLKLALAALFQQKVRTLLTTLAVVFGTFVLVTSVSIGQGVQETIDRESRRHHQLRQIDVWSNWGPREEDLRPDAVEVKGEMSEARRERLSQAILEHGPRTTREGPRFPLTPAGIETLAAIDHVQTVVPHVEESGWAVIGDKTEQKAEPIGSLAVTLDAKLSRRRLLVGDFFAAPDERSALVSEYLLYRWGFVDEADMDRALGTKFRLEFRPQERLSPSLLLTLVNARYSELSRNDEQVLDKAIELLPAALEQLDLPPEDKRTLRRLVKDAPPRLKPGSEAVVAETFTIKGVLRTPTREEQSSGASYAEATADVILPQATAEELYLRVPQHREVGFLRATVTVDEEANVKEVARQITDLGLESRAFLDFIERERFQYLLIFAAMSAVAAVSLLVAALGIANTMLMTVLERTREVGVMKAVGAGDRHIQLIFLVEGALVGVVGGSLGVLLSWAVSFPGDAWIRSIISSHMQVKLEESLFVFPIWLTLGAVAFAVAVTTLAAVYPARRAARVNPITALRHE
jgi:putative ABC transport system permease protein